MRYPVNKGAGNPVEFKGLKSQYLFVFAGGLAMVLLAVVILYLAGVDQWICIPFGSISGGLLVWVTFRLNARSYTVPGSRFGLEVISDITAKSQQLIILGTVHLVGI